MFSSARCLLRSCFSTLNAGTSSFASSAIPSSSSAVLPHVLNGARRYATEATTVQHSPSEVNAALARTSVLYKTYKPITPGIRHLKRPLAPHLYQGRPLRELTIALRKRGGRNSHGHITVRHRGGGHKQRIRIVDFMRTEPGPCDVVRIEYDPGRSAHIALVKNRNPELCGGKAWSYILAPDSMFAARRAFASSLPRCYSTSVKPSVKLIAELRKKVEGVSLTKAHEALAASNNDLEAALAWLDTDRAANGAAKVAKLADRVAEQGLIGIQVLSPGFRAGSRGVRAAMVELNCETDFVARNELFGKLLSDIAHTAAFITEPKTEGRFIEPVSLDVLRDAPLLDHRNPQTAPAHTTVESAVRDLVTKVGEKITLRRAAAVVRDPLPSTQSHLGLRAFPYLHGTVTIPMNGTKGALSLYALKSPLLPSLITSEEFQRDLAALERSLGRTIVGFPTTHIGNPDGEPDPEALYNQPTDMFPNKLGSTIAEELCLWAKGHGLVTEQITEEAGIALLEFEKWSVGEAV